MKKTLTFLSLMAAMATSAVAGTVAIAPAPAPAPVPAWESAVGVEAIAAIADQSLNANLWGPRFSYSMVKAIDEKSAHEVNVGISFLWGDGGKQPVDIDMFQIPLTVGYNYNYAVCDKVKVYAGAKLGVNYLDSDVRYGYDVAWAKDVENDLGYQWSICTGVKYELSEKMDLVLGYEFSRVYTDFAAPNKTVFGYHIINVGVQCAF